MKPQLSFYDTPDGVVAFSTTRHGGVSHRVAAHQTRNVENSTGIFSVGMRFTIIHHLPIISRDGNSFLLDDQYHIPLDIELHSGEVGIRAAEISSCEGVGIGVSIGTRYLRSACEGDRSQIKPSVFARKVIAGHRMRNSIIGHRIGATFHIHGNSGKRSNGEVTCVNHNFVTALHVNGMVKF